jgi:hypothetical protein
VVVVKKFSQPFRCYLMNPHILDPPKTRIFYGLSIRPVTIGRGMAQGSDKGSIKSS